MSRPWEQWEGQVVNGAIHLGRYLGGGERSAVFFTEDVQRDPQKAVIKLVAADSESEELQLSRWELAARLSHPHLMRLFRMGHCKIGDTELLYAVMECAEENLSQVLLERPITSAEAREILEPALDALAYIHGKGFVHGRMKPANILAVNDQLKISSDGLRQIGESSGVSGTPSVYDPPELAGGEISPAGDVWSLGMTLVEALTQRLPVWERTGREEPVVPKTLPAPFLDLAHHCLLRDPQRRCTVADIAARLGQTTPRTQTPAGPQKRSRSDITSHWRSHLPWPWRRYW